MRVLLMFVALMVAACGPSTGQIKVAKTAQYKLPPKSMLDVAVQVAQQTYKLGALDIEGLRFATAPQWYHHDGGRISATNEFTGDFVNAGDRDVQVTLIVKIVSADLDRSMVEVTPKTFQVIAGSPQPRELTPDDPNLPPWVLGRADALAVSIYEQAKRYVASP